MGNQGNPYAGPAVPQNINVAVHNHGAGAAEEKNGFATASLVCGIIGLLLFGIILGPLAIIFACIAFSQNKGSTGGATAGLVLGILDIAGFFIFLAIMNG